MEWREFNDYILLVCENGYADLGVIKWQGI